MTPYERIIEKNRAWIEETFAKLDKKESAVTLRNRDKIPYTAKDGVFDNRHSDDFPPPAGYTWWTNGFWGGMNWLLYEATGNEEYKKTAQRSVELLDDAFKYLEELHHDVGFMWHITAGADYRLTGNKASRARAYHAASMLASRYNASGKFIRAWNGDGKEGWTIIDCMMNIPLLYWASKEFKDPRFYYAAIGSADTAMRDHVRPDGSINHIVNHDLVTGEFLETFRGQGYEVGSCWSRGLAWALYGFVLSYIHTEKQEYLDTAKACAHYYIANAAIDGWLPLVDYRAPEEPVRYDSTAGAICACGLIELAKLVPELEARLYLEPAIKVLRAMDEKGFTDWNPDSDPLLLMGNGAYHDPKSDHIPIIYGDFYYAEALCKLMGRNFLIW